MTSKDLDATTDKICIVHCQDCVSSVASPRRDYVLCVPTKSLVSSDFFCKHGRNKNGDNNEKY